MTSSTNIKRVLTSDDTNLAELARLNQATALLNQRQAQGVTDLSAQVAAAQSAVAAVPGQVAAATAPVVATMQQATSLAIQRAGVLGSVASEADLAGRQAGDWRIGQQIVTWNGNAVTGRTAVLPSVSEVNTLVATRLEVTYDALHTLPAGTRAAWVDGQQRVLAAADAKVDTLSPTKGGVVQGSDGRKWLAVDWRGQVNVLDYLADRSGQQDSTAAFKQAFADALAQGRGVYIPMGNYLTSDTVHSYVRLIYGDVGFVDDGNFGTVINFRPPTVNGVYKDRMPAIAIDGGMYGGGTVRGITIYGPHNWSIANMRTWCDPAKLGYFLDDASNNDPEYAAFAPGVTAWQVNGSNQPTFYDCATDRVKFGLDLNSTDGHVTSYEGKWRGGVAGVLCWANSEDYMFQGGGISGGLAGIMFTTTNQAGHYGGIHLHMYRVHMGFSPVSIMQVKTDDYGAKCAGLYGELHAVRHEQVGECAIFTLRKSDNDGLRVVGGWGFSWSDIYREYPTAPPNWAYNLPPDIQPYDKQQRCAVYLGAVKGVSFDALDAFALVPSANRADAIVARIEYLAAHDRQDLGGLGSERYLQIIGKEPAASLTPRRGRTLREGDALIASQHHIRGGNLLRNPERGENWETQNGGVVVYPPLGEEAAVYTPRALRERYGSAPKMIKLDPLGHENAFFEIRMPAQPLQIPEQFLGYNFYAFSKAGTSFRSRIAAANGEYLHDVTWDTSPGAWVPITTRQGRATAANRGYFSLQIFALQNEPLFLVGVQVNLDETQPYARQSTPYIPGPLDVDGDLKVGMAGREAVLRFDPGASSRQIQFYEQRVLIAGTFENLRLNAGTDGRTEFGSGDDGGLWGAAKKAEFAYGKYRVGDISTGPTWMTGAGAPTSPEPNGSMYLRTDGDMNTTFYVRVGGAWVAFKPVT
ncbi:glycosyl hydrolase family 28-related protein [Deinococcus gobiensis]|uniref:Rhamnogalacturonase A/B/Epimerase-like pectate lyase domain-containing protein n=1 Tax=Deinococcus gobiensis (strain DSM 21396 / JCM 16679 / CGMCC 1.7299 / I-0) TaxID=745776 RepID=H8H2H9_DEIGI|nr:glycosyl hydrolase family 28-related protein [Deinococcus gobiensis]AFD27726.1 hypothetical protein DGo_PB0457 [Deinococcus gobiensis I-0]